MRPCNKTLIFLSLLFVYSPTAMAITDGSGYAILSKMVTLVKTSVDQLKAVKKSLDISEYLEEVEALKEAKTVVEGSDQLSELLEELDEAYDIGKSLTSIEGTGFDELINNLNQIESQYQVAENQSGVDQVRQYIRTIQQLKRLNLLESSHRGNLEKLSDGLNDRDATRSTAHSMAMTTELLMRMEERQLKAQAKQDRAQLEEISVQRSFSSGYRMLGEMHGR